MSDIQIIVTDKFDLLAFDTDCELIFTFVRATAGEVVARVSELLHNLNLGAEIKCGVSDKLICKRLSERRFLNIDNWQPSHLDADFRSDDVIIIVGREWTRKSPSGGTAEFELLFGVAELEVTLREPETFESQPVQFSRSIN